MAKRKRARAQGVVLPVEAEAERSETAASLLPETAPPAPLPRYWTLAPVLALLGLLVSAPAGHGFATLYDIGRVASALGLLLVIARRERPSPALVALGPWAVVLLAFGAGAMLGRHAWDARVFMDIHQAEFGLPSELAWVAIAIGLRNAHRPLLSPLLALGFGWGLIALLVPEPGLATNHIAFFDSLARPNAPLAIALLLALIAAGVALIATLRGRPAPALVRYALPLMGLAAVLAALTSGTPLQSLTVVLVLVSLVIHGDLLAAAAPPSPKQLRAIGVAAVVVISVLWLLLKSQALIASNTDENIYFYMSKILADGKWPYADYFFAHPPLHVVVPGLVFAVFGFSLNVAKLFPMLATLFGGFAVWGIARRSFSPLAAPLAMVLYLFGSEVLKASSNMTGVNMTAMWLLLGTWQALKGHPWRGGMLLGAAVSTGFYAMAPVLAVIATGFFWRAPDDSAERARPGLRHGLALAAGFIIVAGSLNIAFYAIGGDTFLEGVYAYHQQKAFENLAMVETFGGSPGFPGSVLHNVGVMIGGSDFTKEVYYHAHLWLAGLVLPLVVLAARIADKRPIHLALYPTRLFREGADGRALVIWLIAFALFIQYAMFRELYSFYFVLVYPFLALCAGYVVWRSITLIGAAKLGARGVIGAVLATVALVTVGAHALVADAKEGVFDNGGSGELGELEAIGARNPYVWTEPPVLSSLAGITKLLFWDDERLRGGNEPGYHYYIWSKKRGFSALDEVADYIRTNSAPDETIAGSSTLAPLVALLADRRIAADEIDTNTKRFRAQILREPDYWNAICQDHVRYLVSTSSSYFTQDKLEGLPIVQRAFRLDRTFMDTTLRYNAPFAIVLYRRIDGVPCAWN